MTTPSAYLLLASESDGTAVSDEALISYLTVNSNDADPRLVKLGLERDGTRDQTLAVAPLDTQAQVIGELASGLQVRVLESSRRRAKLLSKMMNAGRRLDQVVVDYVLEKPTKVSLREFLHLNSEVLAAHDRNRGQDLVKASFMLLRRFGELSVRTGLLQYWTREEFGEYEKLARDMLDKRIKGGPKTHFAGMSVTSLMIVSVVAGTSTADEWSDFLDRHTHHAPYNLDILMAEAADAAKAFDAGDSADLAGNPARSSLYFRYFLGGVRLRDNSSAILQALPSELVGRGLGGGLTLAEVAEAGCDVTKVLSHVDAPTTRRLDIDLKFLLHNVKPASLAVVYASRHSGRASGTDLHDYAAQQLGDSATAWEFLWSELDQWEGTFSELVTTALAVS